MISIVFSADYSAAATPLYSFGDSKQYTVNSFNGTTLAVLYYVESVSITDGMNSDILIGMDGNDSLNGSRGRQPERWRGR